MITKYIIYSIIITIIVPKEVNFTEDVKILLRLVYKYGSDFYKINVYFVKHIFRLASFYL